MAEITIAESYLQAAIFLGLAAQYLFMTYATGKGTSRGAVLTYMAISVVIAFFGIFLSIILLPQLIGV